MFQRSMWTRLALSLHASRTHEDFDLCEVEGDRLQSPGVPQCLHNAVRLLIHLLDLLPLTSS